ncbi:trans-sialidase, partial [Trypanosoma rangeli]
MCRHVRFYSSLLLLLCMMLICFSSSGVAAGDQEDVSGPFDGMTPIAGAKWEEIEVSGASVTSLRVPSLVRVGDDVFAVAEAQCKKEEEDSSFTGIVSVPLNQIDDAAMEIPTTDASVFCTQFEETSGAASGKATKIMQPTTMAVGSDVYMLLGNYSRTESEPQGSGKDGLGLLLVKGTVSRNNEGTKRIQWDKTAVLNLETKGLHGSLTRLVGGGGSGVVMSDGTLVFPMRATDKGKDVLLSIRFTPSEKKWELPQGTTGEGCRDPSIAEWKEKSLLMMAHCGQGFYDVYKGLAAGRSWLTMREPISRVWGTSLKRQGGNGVRSGFVAADIDGEKVMLLTTPVYSEEKGEGQLHLWVTDNARVHDLGPVSRAGDNAAASSLLYRAAKELILLYEKKNEDSYSLVAMNLTEQLEPIQNMVKAWKEMDTALTNCASTGTVDLGIKNVCKGPIPTEGLVGVWSNSLEGTVWKDEYLGVNATVTDGVTSEEWGVRFKGAAAGAEWPVGSKGQNQPYYFANNKFALVVTVMINAVPEAETPVPLMGVRMNNTEGTALFGLSYTRDNKWEFRGGRRVIKKSTETWEVNKTYQVVMEMDENEWYVHVNGKEIHEGKYNATLFRSHRISHFYFGSDKKEVGVNSHDLTVSSVLLYNKLLRNDDEIEQLSASKFTFPQPGAEET